jgi:hypothetical protein
MKIGRNKIATFVEADLFFSPTATGGGDAKTLQDKSGGHCTKYHMKLHIYVCNPKKG